MYRHFNNIKNILFLFFLRNSILSISLIMSLRNKRSLTDKIDSNKDEKNAKVVKKRKHLTIKSSSADEEALHSVWSPTDWKKTLENIRKMRKDVVAPVDDMGCDQAADLNEPPEV